MNVSFGKEYEDPLRRPSSKILLWKIAGWRNAKDALEGAVQVTLAGEPRSQGNVRQGKARGDDSLRPTHAQSLQILVGRQAEG
jgi:hypothetical protein